MLHRATRTSLAHVSTPRPNAASLTLVSRRRSDSVVSASPFAHPFPGIETREGAPPLTGPSRLERANAEIDGAEEVGKGIHAQAVMRKLRQYDMSGWKGRHLCVGGATGPGSGRAILTAAIDAVGTDGSITFFGRDLPDRTPGYFTGRLLEAYGRERGVRITYINYKKGMAKEGPEFDEAVAALRANGADKGEVDYFHCVTGAQSGMCPGQIPVYVRDIDAKGRLFQWKLQVLTPENVEVGNGLMGRMGYEFPQALAAAGFRIAGTHFFNWRHWNDKRSWDPTNIEYGRNGAYSGSLKEPKRIVDAHLTMAGDSGDKTVFDHYLPTMRSRALPLIPGGVVMASLYEKLMREGDVQHIRVNELGLQVLDRVSRIRNGSLAYATRQRYDEHEAQFDEQAWAILASLTPDNYRDLLM